MIVSNLVSLHRRKTNRIIPGKAQNIVPKQAVGQGSKTDRLGVIDSGNSYSRESSVSNKTKLFQGQEHIDDLGLNWDSFKWRNHMPDIGRFFGVDKLAQKYLYNSPYAFSENKVISHRELEGLESESIHQTVTNINVVPIWQSDVNPRTGDPAVVDHYSVNFTLTQHETSVQYDQQNVVIGKTETTSISTHTVQVPIGGRNMDANAKTNPHPNNLTTNNATALVTTKTTSLATSRENPKSTTTQEFKSSGSVILDKKVSAQISQAVVEKGKSGGLLAQKTMRLLFSSESKSHHRKFEDTSPRH